ncbi:unnamed protein product [Ilex paraguariensis]|uniref:Uncharacterized protein n=1 Tax=Ilex paraguariensis TaxID=185542 RepID=A0ABC8UXP7_9AQUA
MLELTVSSKTNSGIGHSPDHIERVWTTIVLQCGEQWRCDSWQNTIMWAEQVMKGDNLKATLMKLSLALQVASGYYLWLERNERLHRNNYRDVVTVTKGITDMIRSRASRLNKIKATTQNIHLQKQWNPQNPFLKPPLADVCFVIFCC